MSFYITLPSSSKPENRVGKFITSLARTVDLDGAWEVGLAEISLPPMQIHITKPSGIMITENGSEFSSRISFGPDTTFLSMSKLAEYIREKTPKSSLTNKPAFRCELKMKSSSLLVPAGCKVQLYGDMARILGFQPNAVTFDGEKVYAGSLRRWSDFIYIYCDIIEHGFVGDAMAPLLRTVPGSHSEIVIRYGNIHYVPLLANRFDTIEIELTNDLGNEIKFSSGLAILKLHFRPRKR